MTAKKSFSGVLFSASLCSVCMFKFFVCFEKKKQESYLRFANFSKLVSPVWSSCYCAKRVVAEYPSSLFISLYLSFEHLLWVHRCAEPFDFLFQCKSTPWPNLPCSGLYTRGILSVIKSKVMNMMPLTFTLEAHEVKRVLRLASNNSNTALQLQDVLEMTAKV